jgi:DNA-binding response OmpR family regulator
MILVPRPLNVEVISLSEVPFEGSTPSDREHEPLILVVDDERLIADTLSTIFTKAGFSAAKAYDGESALTLARKTAPAILIADVGLPGMNGIALSAAVSEIVPGCSILLLSSHPEAAEQVVQANAKGYDFQFFHRPVHPTVLVQRISELIATKDVQCADRFNDPRRQSRFTDPGILHAASGNTSRTCRSSLTFPHPRKQTA